ncbi:unnamed protein product, partial [Rotaria sp. Silwood2]
YTRIGLGDPNKNSYFFKHCRLHNGPTSCFHIVQQYDEKMIHDGCYSGSTSLEEMEDHVYMSDQSLLSENSKTNRVLMSKTNNLIPNFVENFLRIQQLIFNN